MKSGDILNNKYQIISRVSIKGFRQKWLANNNLTGNKVLVETLHDDLINDENAIEDIRHDLIISQQLDSEMIPKCIDTFIFNTRMFLVWEYYDNETLSSAYKHNFFKNISDQEILILLLKIGKTIAYAHSHNIVHGNINGETILIDPKLQPQIINFASEMGFEATDPGTKSIFSVINLTSPEIKQGEKPNNLSDFYSIGMIGKLLLLKPENRFQIHDLNLRSLHKSIDLSVAHIIDGLCSPDLTIRTECISRFLDNSFLDPYKTPSKGIDNIKISKYRKWKIVKKYKDG
jgi:serine/threonine protein kinase